LKTFSATYNRALSLETRKRSPPGVVVVVVVVYSADRHRIDIARNKYYNTSSTSVDPCPFNGLVLTAQ
jgi:hypothetical protein